MTKAGFREILPLWFQAVADMHTMQMVQIDVYEFGRFAELTAKLAITTPAGAIKNDMIAFNVQNATLPIEYKNRAEDWAHEMLADDDEAMSFHKNMIVVMREIAEYCSDPKQHLLAPGIVAMVDTVALKITAFRDQLIDESYGLPPDTTPPTKPTKPDQKPGEVVSLSQFRKLKP